MEITSVVYIGFIAASLGVYWIMPKGKQWIVLLVDSLLFYFLNAEAYTFIYLMISVITVWLATNYFKRSADARHKKLILMGTLFINMGILAVLKYTNLGITTINFVLKSTLGHPIPAVDWVASLAISFYTLQLVSYLLDAYWGVAEIQRNPAKLLLFTSFFPLMISGPINTHDHLNSQLFAEHRFDYAQVTQGMKRIAWGLMKVLAISSRLAIMVNALWDNVDRYPGVWIWIAIVGYVIQLYTDFSGCMDIVIGVSECFGIRLMENFNAPLFSKSIQEFWQRWHMTLGLWLRNYILNPLLKSRYMVDLGEMAKKALGKKRGKKIPLYVSLLALWLAMGVWHGDSWKYILGEGVWFWAVIVLGQVVEPSVKAWKKGLNIRDGWLWKTWQVIRTNLIFAVGMMFFRAESLTDALFRFKQSLNIQINWGMINSAILETASPIGSSGMIVLAIALALLIVHDAYLYRGISWISRISEKKSVVRWLVYAIIIFMICASYNLGGEEFAYAQF